jgi:arginine/lysine/histidine transporter system substrate-binding protein
MSIQKLLSIALAACTLLITACGEKKKSDSRTIVVGTSADYAPYEFFKDGQMVGFDIELMREIGKRLGKEVEFKDLSFDAIVGSLKAERIDAAISSITPTEERRKSVDFSDEYTESKNPVMICRGTSTVTTIEDLVNETIGVQSGSTHEDYAKNNLSKVVTLTVKSLGKIPDLIQDMNAGRVSCLVLGPEEAREIVKSYNNMKTINLPDTVPGFVIAFPKGSLFVKLINKILDDMKADGSLGKLKEKWLSQQ